MKKVHLDFESRSTVDIWSAGAYNYAVHPSTEIMCVAYAIDSDPVKIIRWADIQMYPLIDPFEEIRELAKNKNCLFYSHNSLFEQLIWEHKLRGAFSVPRMPILRWRCTAAKALAHNLPKRLLHAAEALSSRQQKDSAGHAIMLKLCKPKADGTWEENPDLILQLENYCAQDVQTEREIDNMLPELDAFEQYVWFEDQLINQRGIAVDVPALDKCLDLIDKETTQLLQEIKTATNGELDGVSRRQMVLNYFAQKGVKLPDFTKATVETALKDGTIPPELTQVLRIRQQLGLTSTAKYRALKDAVSSDGRLRDTLVYHSAGTGRWSGKTVQLQNLPKGTVEDTGTAVELVKDCTLEELRMVYGNIMGLLSSCIRGMFVAAPGHELVVADYSAIEARVLMWFCGQADAVKMFREGEDIYVAMARVIYGKENISKKERHLGKQTILGSGYGMGPDKFKATCAGYGIEVSDELAIRAINSYRGAYKNVVNMWYAQERAMKAAIQMKQKIRCGNVDWQVKGNFLYCTLPSGRALAYHKARIENDTIKYMATDSVTKQYGWKDIYSSKIVEHLCQAIARDILAHAMLQSERKGYPIVLTVHDELVAEVEKGHGSVEEFVKIITGLPSWAKGCPIAAEGWTGERYKK